MWVGDEICLCHLPTIAMCTHWIEQFGYDTVNILQPQHNLTTWLMIVEYYQFIYSGMSRRVDWDRIKLSNHTESCCPADAPQVLHMFS
jgi:hypothetical protein